MSLPIYLFNKPVIGLTSSVSGAMTANISSVITNIQEASGYCVQAVYTGSPVGTIQILASNDGVNFVPAPGTSPTAVSGAGSFMFNVDGIHYGFIQVLYTFTSGTGALTASVSAKRK